MPSIEHILNKYVKRQNIQVSHSYFLHKKTTEIVLDLSQSNLIQVHVLLNIMRVVFSNSHEFSLVSPCVGNAEEKSIFLTDDLDPGRELTLFRKGV